MCNDLKNVQVHLQKYFLQLLNLGHHCAFLTFSRVEAAIKTVTTLVNNNIQASYCLKVCHCCFLIQSVKMRTNDTRRRKQKTRNSAKRSDAASSKSALKVTFNFIQNLGGGGGDMEAPPVLKRVT